MNGVESQKLRAENPWASSLGLPVRQTAKQISVLSEVREGKVLEEWAGEASIVGFEISPQPPEKLCIQNLGWSIAS